MTVDRLARMRGEEPGIVPVVTNDPQGQSAVPGMLSYNFFEGARQNRARSWENKVTIRRSVPMSLAPLHPEPSPDFSVHPHFKELY
jgi:hypothetical protein